MDHDYLKSLVVGYTALPELVQALDLKSNPRHLTSLLDLEIQRKKEALRDLQAYRNFLAAPISALPPEILADIFHIYASASNGLFDLSWTKIMLVCQTWRSIGLSTASLWSCLDFDGLFRQRRLTEQLQRSRGWPLDVRARLYISGDSWTDGALVDLGLFPIDSGRVRSLDVRGDSSAITSFLEHVVSPAPTCPLLCSLTIQYTTTKGIEKDGIPLLNHLVSGGAPSLYALNLRHITPLWENISGLTSLEVNGAEVNNVTLLETLSRCPGLRLLDVSLSPAVDDSIPRDNLARIPLSALQSLQLHATSIVTCCHLLSSLNIPPDASLSLPTTMTFGEMRTSRVCSQLRRHYQAHGARPMRTIFLRARSHSDGEWQSVEIDVFSYVNLDRFMLDSLSYSTHEMPYLSLVIVEATPNRLRQALASILDALPVERLTHVNAGSGDSLSKKTWKTILPMLPDLTTITMRADLSALTAIEGLDWFVSTKQRRPVSHLRFDCVCLATGRSTDDDARNIELAKEAFGAALAHASRAKALGHPLDTIELSGGRWDNSARQVIQGASKKNVYRLLTAGFIVDGLRYDKEKTKGWGRTRRRHQRVLEIAREEWEPTSDSEVEAELDAEEGEISAINNGGLERDAGKGVVLSMSPPVGGRAF
ncbi:hypothetical protein PENSPDRAFT_756769 [Peniophora sp. CONT]|nr:hypothetical protein PENSPDRAFT_756769 [Peniophora sp. CONT]